MKKRLTNKDDGTILTHKYKNTNYSLGPLNFDVITPVKFPQSVKSGNGTSKAPSDFNDSKVEHIESLEEYSEVDHDEI